MTSAPSPVTCICCRLPQPQAVDHVTGVTARVCAQCTHHQGDQDGKRLQRAESHERMLRVRLEKCRVSEQEAAATARDARDRVASALASRGRLAARIVEAAEDDPSHRCAVTDVARDSQVLQWARRAQQPHPNDRWPV